jgi:hypothetical protein
MILPAILADYEGQVRILPPAIENYWNFKDFVKKSARKAAAAEQSPDRSEL